MKRITFGICALALIAMISSTANAATFFSDSFSYPAGQLTGAEGGANVSGGLWQSHSGSTSGKIQVTASGEAVSVNGTGTGEDANRFAGRVIGGNNETWYYGALITVNDTRAGSGEPLDNQSYVIHFKDSGTFNFVTRTHVTDPSTGVGGTADGFRFGLSAGSGDPQAFSPDLNFDQEYKVMASFDATTGTANLWVDPTDINSPSVTHTDPGRVGTLIEALAIRQDFVSSGPTFDALFNSVAIGDDFDSVMRNAMNGSDIRIPEPTALALTLLGLAGIAGTRRRS